MSVYNPDQFSNKEAKKIVNPPFKPFIMEWCVSPCTVKDNMTELILSLDPSGFILSEARYLGGI